MSENKKYYWLKLDENFFEDDTITWLEEQENGKDYVIFYLKLCLKSLSDDGSLIRIVGQTLIPYDVPALARLTNTKPDTVAVAMKTFKEIGLIEIKESGEIYLSQINEMIGSETAVAKRVRKHRVKKALKQENEKALQSNIDETKSNTEYRDRDRDRDRDKTPAKAGEESATQKRRDDFEKLWKLYPKKQRKQDAFKAYEKAIKKGVTNEEIQEGIVKYKEHLKETGTKAKYIAQGGTWFNQERWNDEYDTDDFGEELEKGRYYDELGF